MTGIETGVWRNYKKPRLDLIFHNVGISLSLLGLTWTSSFFTKFPDYWQIVSRLKLLKAKSSYGIPQWQLEKRRVGHSH